MEVSSAGKPDRRHRKRAASIAEAQMAADEVAALNLAQVARRMGLTPAALYQYFAAKNAVYDALFALGMGELEHVLAEAEQRAQTDPRAAMITCQVDILRWCTERPVPGFEPSERTWASAQAQFLRLRALLNMAGTAGQVRPEGAGDDAMEILVCLAWFATGRFNPKLYPLVDHMTLYKHC